jgi:pyruvate carboxylase
MAAAPVTFELNGMTREVTVTDRSVQPKAKTRPKADPADPLQVAAPIPGLITSLAVNVGAKVAKGDKLLTLEAMKMQSTIYAPATARWTRFTRKSATRWRARTC